MDPDTKIAVQLLLRATEELPTSEWAKLFIKRENGEPLDFDNHRYLKDIYDDESPYLACLKAAQIGFSTMAIIKTMRKAKKDKMSIIYILPTADMVEKFVGSKVNPIINQSPIIREWIKDKDKVSEKQVGDSYIFYSGSQTDRSAIMVSADMLVSDEHDKSPQNILETYDSRLQHSAYGYKWVFSNPTSSDFGVDKYWKLSDQKKWHIKHSCGAQVLLDESTINYEKEIFECPSCKKEITAEERRMGEWVPTASGKWSGYWIPLWISPTKSAKDIKEYKSTKTAEYFANFVAGLPYAGSGNKVSAATIIKCLSSKVNTQSGRIIIGVDTGLPIHYVLVNQEGWFHYGTCPDATTLEGFLKRWPSAIIISDGNAEQLVIRPLRAKYPGRVFLTFYNHNRQTDDMIKWQTGDKYGEVVVQIDKVIQQMIDEMTDKRHTFNGTESEWQEYITHWLNIYRTWDVDDSGQIDKAKGYKWERTGPDHWVSATIFARIGLEKFGKTLATIVDGDPFSGIPNARIY